jgi:hypothetical protein
MFTDVNEVKHKINIILSSENASIIMPVIQSAFQTLHINE